MTMRPGGAVFGSLVGAGGVTAYNAYHSNDWGIVRTLQWWIEKGQADTARANNPELARLEDMIGRLSRDMATKGREVHYMPSHSGTGYSTFYIASGGIVVGFAYLRVWKGWTFSSMMPVTKEALKQGLSTIRSGVDGLSKKIQEVKDFVDERVDALSRKQDNLAESQDEMKDQLEDVQQNISGMRGDIKAIERDMKDFKENQMYTNDGIFALCSVVKELVGPSQKTNRPNTALHLLDKFLFKSPQLPMHRTAGLESLLMDSSTENTLAQPWPPAARTTSGRVRANSPVNVPRPVMSRARTQSEGLTGFAASKPESAFAAWGLSSPFRPALKETRENSNN